MKNPAAVLALAFFTACTLPAVAAEDSIGTDRPDFVESSDTVGKGRFQIETSVAFERTKTDGVRERTWSTPTLFRVGVSETLELRLETDGWIRQRIDDSSTGERTSARGGADASVGLKWHVVDGDEKKGTPGVALLAHVDLDSGSSAFRGNGLRPSLRVTAEWELPNEFGLGIMPGVAWEKTAEGHRYAAGILAVTLNRKWSDQLKTFIEVAGQRLASKRNGGSTVTFDLGATWLLSKDIQVDTAIQAGLTKESPDLAVTVGLSMRF